MKRFLIMSLLTFSLFGAANASEVPFSGKQQKSEYEVTLVKDTKNAEGVRHITVEPAGVCSYQIDIDAKDGVILKVVFGGGCSGNTQGVAKLVQGMKVTEAIEKLEGIRCGNRPTSCPDQLARALKLLL